MRESGNSFWAVLGPGILYTAAAVGVSHLVYAIRAGAVYGLAMIPFILFFCMIK
jgi:Mn2+/Fe2+ NRAMP family transporter